MTYSQGQVSLGEGAIVHEGVSWAFVICWLSQLLLFASSAQALQVAGIALLQFPFAAFSGISAVKIPFQTIAKGARSGVREASQVVVRDQAQWQALWQKHTSINTNPVPPLDVDFDKEIVMAVFAGDRPTGGYGIEITSADLSDGVLTVSFNEKGPRPGEIQLQALTQPFHIVRVRNNRIEEVRFRRVS